MVYKVYTADGNGQIVVASNEQQARADVARLAIRLPIVDMIAYYQSTIINRVEPIIE
jgi:hypothetical protein